MLLPTPRAQPMSIALGFARNFCQLTGPIRPDTRVGKRVLASKLGGTILPACMGGTATFERFSGYHRIASRPSSVTIVWLASQTLGAVQWSALSASTTI